jgi:PKHD-type hydroxylase
VFPQIDALIGMGRAVESGGTGGGSVRVIIENLLSADDLAAVRAIVESGTFVDGRETSTLTDKRNVQLPLDSPAADRAGALILDRLLDNETFQSAALPRQVVPPRFSRYEIGMGYPAHVDSATMGACRTDLAMTVFLSDLDRYDGGDLVVDTGNGERRYRLPAGDAILYPASTLHSVAPVTAGTRLVAVTWVQSLVRDPLGREILTDLALSAARLSATPYGPRLRRSYHNLLRLWAET